RRVDPATSAVTDEPILYDAKDLTTHALCVGMTGSGKTGLCVSLLEEAAIDGVPVLAIDPKGDLGNLLLTFPKLKPADFEPWIDEGAALRAGRTKAEHAEATAKQWSEGLADWGQGSERIQKLRDSAEAVLYTPGSSAGRPLAILGALDPPPAAILEDSDLLRERVGSAVGGLLALLGIDADPLSSREHILLASILEHAWRAGESTGVGALVRSVQEPPFTRLGVLDLDTFFPASDRFALAMRLNNLVASSSFAAWSEGDRLSIPDLLWTPEGKPRIAIVSIAHLSESERMFVVTALLNEMLTWMRTQSGSSSLRALVYMDEVFGFFPPNAEPPAKRPMLTLLKQARAFGVGVVLATQNPVDLDYKGLSNCGTWFLGRLQTERDQARVLDGLESAGGAAEGFDRKEIEKALSSMPKRTFLLHNVHEDAPLIFHTRWALSYLAGPLSRKQIRALTADSSAAKPAANPTGNPTGKAASKKASSATSASIKTKTPTGTAAATKPIGSDRPVFSPGIIEAFAMPSSAAGGAELRYRAFLHARVTVHYADTKRSIDEWSRVDFLTDLAAADTMVWENSRTLTAPPSAANAPDPTLRFESLDKSVSAKSITRWSKQAATHAYRTRDLPILECKALKLYSRPGEGEAGFRGRLTTARREKRDLAIEKLRKRYAPKIRRAQDAIERAQHRIQVETEQVSAQKTSTAVSIGSTVLGALFGRKLGSATNVGRAATVARSASRISKEKEDVRRAQERAEAAITKLDELERDFEDASIEIRDKFEDGSDKVTTFEVSPRKSDLAVEACRILWLPCTGERIVADINIEPQIT
ncbi:MAG: hypothetical protein ACI91F_001705, partial [Candidatus Binatia bacterium]